MNIKTSVVKRACKARRVSRVLALALSVAFVVPHQIAFAASDTENGAVNSIAVSESQIDSPASSAAGSSNAAQSGSSNSQTRSSSASQTESSSASQTENREAVKVADQGKTEATRNNDGRKIASVLGKLRERRKVAQAAKTEAAAAKAEAAAQAAAKSESDQGEGTAQKSKIAVLLKWKDTPSKSSRKNSKNKLASKDSTADTRNKSNDGGEAGTVSGAKTTAKEDSASDSVTSASSLTESSEKGATDKSNEKGVAADATSSTEKNKQAEVAKPEATASSDADKNEEKPETSASQMKSDASESVPQQKSEPTLSDAGTIVVDEPPASLDKDKRSVALGVTAATAPLDAQAVSEGDGPFVVDNDEEVESKEGIRYEELPTTDGKTRVRVGAHFPVIVSSQLSSKTTKKGDAIEARLKYDLKIGDRLVAEKGDVVRGHINYSLPARTILHSLVSPERWYRNSGCLGVKFDEIITKKGEHLPLVAAPAQKGRIVKNKAEGRELGVNHNGQITGPWAQQLRYKAVRVGLNAALAPAGVFSFGAMPVALGLIGAANPAFAFSKPVGLNVRHRRIKGFCWGFLSGIPGSWLIEDTVVKGQEAVIKPGDEFLVEFREEFTGEPASDASLLPGSTGKVKGEVIRDPNKKKKK